MAKYNPIDVLTVSKEKIIPEMTGSEHLNSVIQVSITDNRTTRQSMSSNVV